jgi:hypothetical protein
MSFANSWDRLPRPGKTAIAAIFIVDRENGDTTDNMVTVDGGWIAG